MRLLSVLFVIGAIAPELGCQENQGLVLDRDRAIRDSRGGGGAAYHIASAILKQTRKINIAFPASYKDSPPTRRFPVIVVFDGEAYLAPVAAVSEELSRNGLIPEAIIVAIENEDPYRGRVHDLTPPGLSVSGSGLNEGGDVFLDFIEKELLPAVDRQFKGGLPRAIVGHSSGGILATYAAATRPNFRAVVAIDAPVTLSGNWLAEKLLARARTDKIPLRFAYYQARFPWPEANWKAIEANLPVNWKIHREQFQREGHETAFMLGAYLGLREVFGDYSRIAAPEFPTTSKLTYYEKVSATFGAKLLPPKRIFRDLIEDFLMEGRGKEARKAYGQLVSEYGSPSDSAAVLKHIAEVELQPPPTETVESLLATPFPSAEQIQSYVGDWAGIIWMRAGRPPTYPNILHIKVVDGKVVAELERPDAPEEIRHQSIQYLKVTAGGLTFGFMNGMRPRGMLMHEGVLKGDTLSGKQKWGGIRFKLDIPGEEPVDPGFSFVRKKL